MQLLPVVTEFSGIGLMNAADDFNQRAFSSPISPLITHEFLRDETAPTHDQGHGTPGKFFVMPRNSSINVLL